MNLMFKNAMISLVVLLSLSGCSTQTETKVIQLSDQISYTLSVPPEELIATTQTHLIEASFDGKTQRFIAQVEYQYEQISLAGISPSGLPLFDFVWQKGKAITINRYVPLPGLDLHYVVADMQWINWPIESLIAATAGENLSIKQTISSTDLNKGNGQKPSDWLRVVKHHDNVVLAVEKISNQYFLTHNLRNYSIKVTDVSKDKK